MDASGNDKSPYFRFVSGVYDEAGGTDDRPVDARMVAQKSLGSDLDAATQALVLHLQGEGLIRVVSMANGLVSSPPRGRGRSRRQGPGPRNPRSTSPPPASFTRSPAQRTLR